MLLPESSSPVHAFEKAVNPQYENAEPTVVAPVIQLRKQMHREVRITQYGQSKIIQQIIP